MASGDITVPQVDFYGMLSGIGNTIAKREKENREQSLRDAFKDGLPRAENGGIDYDAVNNTLSQHGADVGSLLTVAKMAQDQRKADAELKASGEFRGMLGGLFGGAAPAQSGTPAQAIQQPAERLPPASVGGPIQPTAKVWGDKEAEDVGLYEKPAPAKVSFGDALGGKRPDPLATMRTPDQPPMQAAMAGQPQMPAPMSAQPPAAPQSQPAAMPQPAKTGFDGIGVQHVPALISSMANPRLPASDRELAGKLLGRALDDAKEPDKIRTLNALKEQSGYPGTILQLEMDMRKHSGTQVNIDQRGEGEEAKAAGKAAGERRAAMFGAANNATNNLATLTRVGTLLDQVDQGKLAPGRMNISAWAKSLGMNDDFAKGLGLDPTKVGTSQAVQAMTNELVLGKIGAGGLPANNFSDADRQFLTDTLPKLGNDPRANKILIEAARRVHQGSIQRALDYQTWKEDPASKSKSFEDFELSRAKQISQMDRFGDLRKQAETLVPSSDGMSGEAGGISWRIK